MVHYSVRTFLLHNGRCSKGSESSRQGLLPLGEAPSIYGGLLTLVGLGLALQSWGAVLLFALIFSLTFGYRIYVEERVLVSELGDEYVKYTKRTKRLIPYIL